MDGNLFQSRTVIGEKGVPVGLTGGSLLVELVASMGSTVATFWVFFLFYIHKTMVDLVHYAESAVQVPFL